MSLAAFIRRLLGRSRPVAPATQGSVPLRLSCRDLDAVPSAVELTAMAVVGQHIVLQFPRGSIPNKRPLIERLAAQLPGHRVFDSGPGPGDTDCVTVYRVLDESVVVAHLPLFLAAIRDFADTARNCCHELAAAHGIAAADLLDRRNDIGWRRRVGEWNFYFHGFECCFTHRRTGQVVDVRLGFGDEFGVLDPYFLARFIRTTAAHHQVAALLADDFHDLSRVLEVLLARGHLRVIEVANSVLSGMMMRGLVLASDGDNVPTLQRSRSGTSVEH
ncbi:MAG: hypothetical protein J0I06_10625 [Planctomycetes bacterium]|nr:hypothetical protein [Planctomycetota bacterium]